MALSLASAFVGGGRRVLTTTGGVLFGLLLALQAVLLVSLNSAVAAQLPAGETPELGLTLPVSGTVGVALFGVALLGLAVYYVVASRAFARPTAELSAFPRALYARRVGRATLWMVVGGLVAFVSTFVGFLFFVLPGLFLAASFFFFIFAVGVEDRGAVAGLRRSWQLSRGNRLRLVALVLLVSLASSVLGGAGVVLGQAGAPVVGDAVSIVVNSALFVFIYAVMADVYLQVRDDGTGEARGGRVVG